MNSLLYCGVEYIGEDHLTWSGASHLADRIRD
jgi:hypothetical protein